MNFQDEMQWCTKELREHMQLINKYPYGLIRLFFTFKKNVIYVLDIFIHIISFIFNILN